MKNSLFFLLFVIGSLIIGCSSDDKGSNGDNGDDEILQPRLVATEAETGPSMFDAGDAMWYAIDSAIVQVGFSDTYGQNPQLFKDTLYMRAIKTSDMLYLWAHWYDQTPDIWGNYCLKSEATGMWEHITLADYGGGEDAFFIIFDVGDNGDEGADCATMCHAIPDGMATTGGGHVDAWAWKSSKTAPARLAEDQWWSGSGNFLDPAAAINPQTPYRPNWSSFLARPAWMHEDDTAFHGPYLFTADAIEFDSDPFIGWEDVAGYKMPGHLIDSTIYLAESRNDRWNVLSASHYDSLSARRSWTVVLARALAPASASDADLRELDSIQVTVAVSSDHTFGEDETWRDHSGSIPFYIIFPTPQ